MSKLVRNTVGLRDALFEEWESLRDGSSNPARARSIAMMANAILQSVQVEIEYHKYVTDINKLPANNEKAIGLGGATQIQLGELHGAAGPGIGTNATQVAEAK
jgi:hypothetical protein